MFQWVQSLKSKENNLSIVAKASLAYVLVNILNKGISFLASPIYTRILTEDEYGQVSVWLSWVSLIGCIAMFCLSSGVFNNGMLDYKDDRDRYSFSLLILSNIITLSVGVVYIVIQRVYGNPIDIDASLSVLMFLIFLLQPAFNFWVTRQRYEYKYKMASAVTLSSVLISTIVAVVLITLVSQNKVYGRLFGAEIPLILIYAAFYILLAIKAKFRVNMSYWKEAFKFNLPLIPHYFSGYILNHSDRLMISYLLDDKCAAFYSLAYSISALISTIWLAINSALIPYTYEKCKNKEYGDLSKTTSLILLVFAVPCILIILIAPELISILAPSSYHESINVIPPIIGGVFVSSLYYIFANVIYYHKKPKYVMFASVSSALLNIVLNYIFIPRFGYAAAGYTTIICYSLQAILDYFAMRKVVKEKVYDIRVIFSISIIVIVVSLLSVLIYPFAWIRYAIVAIALILSIIFRKSLVSLFHKIKK